MKICSVCLIEKPFSDFPKSKVYANGVRAMCKICHNDYNKKYRSSEIGKQYHKQKSADWVKQNPLKNKAKKKKYRSNPKNRDHERAYNKNRIANSPALKIECAARCRLKEVLRVTKIYNSTRKLIGCSRDELVNHLSSLFKPGMTLENHGIKGWHIDHILPCSSFDLTDEDQVKQCFHYTNLQPLWWNENLTKGNKINLRKQKDEH